MKDKSSIFTFEMSRSLSHIVVVSTLAVFFAGACLDHGGYEDSAGYSNALWAMVDDSGSPGCTTDEDCDTDGVSCTVSTCNVETGVCSEELPSDDACDDGDDCNGVETCDEVLDCQPGVEKDCDDGVDCTDDFCSPGDGECQNVIMEYYCEERDEDLCDGVDYCDTTDGCKSPDEPVDCSDGNNCTEDECDPETGECSNSTDECPCDEDEAPPAGPSLSISYETPDNMRANIPFVNKRVGVSCEASASVDSEAAHCSNDCKATAEAEISGGCEVELGVISVGLELTGGYNTEVEECLSCDDSTEECNKQCSGTVCETNEISGEGSLSVSRDFGIPEVSAGVGPVSASFVCSATLSVDAHGSLSKKKVEPGDDPEDCEACDQCEEISGSAGLGGSATGSCGLEIKLWGYEKNIGCDECISVGVSVDGNITKKSGDCGNETCSGVTGKVEGMINATRSVEIGWWEVELGCSIETWGSVTADSCEGFSTDGDFDPSCNVDISWL